MPGKMVSDVRPRNTENPNKIKWLPFLDMYRTMCLAPQPEFRRLLEQAADLPIAA